MTDEMSPITISELQNTENQVDNNSAIAIAELQAEGRGHLQNHRRNAGRTAESLAGY